SGRVPVGGAPLGCRRRSQARANFHPLGHRRRSGPRAAPRVGRSRASRTAVSGVAGHALGPEVPTSDVVVAELPQPPDDHGRPGRASVGFAFIDPSLRVGPQRLVGAVVPPRRPGAASRLLLGWVSRTAPLAAGEEGGAGDRAPTHFVPTGAPPTRHT